MKDANINIGKISINNKGVSNINKKDILYIIINIRP